MISVDTLPRSDFFTDAHDSRLLEEATDIKTMNVSVNTQVGYVVLNQHLRDSEPAIVAVGGFMSDITTPDRAWEGVHLARLNRPVYLLDMPGHGFSSPHSRQQVIDLCLGRSVDSQADPLTDAVLKLLDPTHPVDYFGISHGALLSLKMTEQDPEDRIRTVFGIDMPAVRRRFTLGLQAGYIVSDNIIGRKKYLEALAGSDQEADYEKFKAMHQELSTQRAKSFIHNNPGLFFLNLFASVNARPVALETWTNVLKEKTARIEVVTAGNSGVSDARAIQAFIESLSPAEQRRSHQTVIENENHNIGMVHLMPRAVAWARSAYAA
jgi:pimeloyl-ACP methyl ester carboxylesterase